MKKAKIIMTSFAVLTIVGGALAFKSAAFNRQNVYCPASGPSCVKQNFTTVNNGSSVTTTQPCGTDITTFYTTNVGNQSCTDNSYTSGTVYQQSAE